jgi:hypothetical protein
MSPRIWRKPQGKISIYMRRIRECNLFKNLGMEKIKERWIKGGKNSSHLYSREINSHINKFSKHKVSLT